MLICGIQKLSLLDYPEKLAATIFTGGCNFRCPFCHNAGLVTKLSESEKIPETEILDFLKKRVGKLDGVCISGGEPLLQGDIADFIKKIRALGFKIKLDTNGAYPAALASLLDAGLLDYVAMDFKNSPEKYAMTIGVPNFDPAPVLESAHLLMNSGIPHEFRTTLVSPLHTESDMVKIGEALKGAENLFLQSFVDSGDLVGFGSLTTEHDLEAFTIEEIQRFRDILAPYFTNVTIRG